MTAFGSKAQTLPNQGSPVSDTVRTEIYKNNNDKVKIVDGVAMSSGRDLIVNLSKADNYSLFVKAVRSGGLIETFRSRGPITVFVPGNAAFNSLPPGKLDTLLKKNHLLELDNLITYHAVPGNLRAKDIAGLIHSNNGEATLTTVAGSKLKARIDTNRNLVLVDENGGQSIISIFDVPQSNGIMHVVTQVLVPKYKVI